jgi:hypothetical protein
LFVLDLDIAVSSSGIGIPGAGQTGATQTPRRLLALDAL